MAKEKLLTQLIGPIKKGLFILWVLFPGLIQASLQEDFYELMGKKQPVWQFLLQEDKQVLEKFAESFNRTLLQTQTKRGSIPNTFHFIWVGSNEFPAESIKNIQSWVERHPGYKVYFWSDRERVLPHSCMQLRLIDHFNWLFLKDLYLDSNNPAEKSDLLRYEILYQEGGIYLDHDVECFKPFNQFIDNFDLFCGLEFPHSPIATTSITVCNNIIGSCPHHPILKKAMELVADKWTKYKKMYPGHDADSVTRRVYHRTFSSFDDAVKMLLDDATYRNIVFPAGYFNKLGKQLGLYAHHQYANTWFEKESKFEKNVRQRLVKICKKNNQLMLIMSALFLISSLVIFALFLQMRALRKRLESFLPKDHS